MFGILLSTLRRTKDFKFEILTQGSLFLLALSTAQQGVFPKRLPVMARFLLLPFVFIFISVFYSFAALNTAVANDNKNTASDDNHQRPVAIHRAAECRHSTQSSL